MIIPNEYKRYTSTRKKSLIYSVILRRRCLTIYCYRGGDPVAVHTIGTHAYNNSPDQYFSVVRPIPFDDRQLIKAESGMLLLNLWDTIDFDELEKLLGRPSNEW